MPTLVSDPHKIDAAWLTDALHGAGVAKRDRVASFEKQVVGTGQMGRSVRFNLEWEAKRGDSPASVVAKFPSDDPKSRATGVAHGAYEKEIRFYNELRATVDIQTPRCFFAEIDTQSGDFVALMEDLAPAVPGNQLAGCTADQAALAIAEAARLHAPRWGDERLRQLEFLKAPNEEVGGALQMIYQALLPGFTERYQSRLSAESLELIERLAERLSAWATGSTSPLTIVHGDFRLDNMLFGTPAGGYPLAVVDWQTTALGAGLSDVAYFIGAGLLPEDRRTHEESLVREYHQRLCAAGITGYDWNQCFLEYRRSAFAGVVMAVVASMIVEQTERGDEMFIAMASRHAQHALDLESEALLGETPHGTS